MLTTGILLILGSMIGLKMLSLTARPPRERPTSIADQRVSNGSSLFPRDRMAAYAAAIKKNPPTSIGERFAAYAAAQRMGILRAEEVRAMGLLRDVAAGRWRAIERPRKNGLQDFHRDALSALERELERDEIREAFLGKRAGLPDPLLTVREQEEMRAKFCGSWFGTNPPQKLAGATDDATESVYVISCPDRLSPQLKKQLSRAWAELFKGTTAPRCILLEGGLTVAKLGSGSRPPDLSHGGDLDEVRACVRDIAGRFSSLPHTGDAPPGIHYGDRPDACLEFPIGGGAGR